MEIKVYRWNDAKIDIFGLIEFASGSKLNMIKAFDIVLMLGKKYPDIEFCFYGIDVVLGVKAKSIDVNENKSSEQIFEDIENVMLPGFVKVRIVDLSTQEYLMPMAVYGLLSGNLPNDFRVDTRNGAFVRLRISSVDKKRFLEKEEVTCLLNQIIPSDKYEMIVREI